MTLGSLFDGIAGFPLAAERQGIKTVWISEIEANCIEIAKRHFPDAENLGDITKIDGGSIPAVDIISFGSPCQDLSAAGGQKGLDGARSGLFMEAVRIVREMRKKTNGEYPKYIIWENVAGAFSSNKGEDFRRVLEEITESNIPMPKSGKWANAGMVGIERAGGVVQCTAWRMLDAQFWGVPQRRKRIYLVSDFGSGRAGQILFECESVLGYHSQGTGEAKGNPNHIENSVVGTDCRGMAEEPGGQMKLDFGRTADRIYINATKSVKHNYSDATMKTKVIVGGAGEGANRVYVTVGGGTGFDLREVFLDAKDINKDELTEKEYLEALRTRGQEYLNENKIFENFEAEAEADVNFIYGKDYDLGDVVTVKKKKWNTTQNLRITELCEVYEYGGMYVVPTFGDALPTTIKWDE